MKKCECKCGDCRTEFIISFKKSVPPWQITCPVCGSKVVKEIWIDKNGED